MHPFIFCFVHQRPNPAAVILHQAKRPQMGQGRADHAGHPGDSLQHDRAIAVTLCEKRVGSPAQCFGYTQSKPVGKTERLMMGGLNIAAIRHDLVPMFG